MTMNCWVYKSLKKDEMYVYLEKEEGFDCLPEALQARMGVPEFVMQLTLHPGLSLAREEVATVMKNIKMQGFHLQMPSTLIPDLYFGD